METAYSSETLRGGEPSPTRLEGMETSMSPFPKMPKIKSPTRLEGMETYVRLPLDDFQRRLRPALRGWKLHTHLRTVRGETVSDPP